MITVPTESNLLEAYNKLFGMKFIVVFVIAIYTLTHFIKLHVKGMMKTTISFFVQLALV